MTTSNLRLPLVALPQHYDLTLEPDLETGKFRGTCHIDLIIETQVDELVCHAADLEIEAITITAGTTTTLDWVLDTDSSTLTMTSSKPFAAGPARLGIEYRGELNDLLRGFYRSTFTDEDGVEHTIATTQFQSTDARRAFPCWDEPAFKATFDVTLIVADGLLAISNTSETENEQLADGRRRIRFARTMKMSTYLVAFVVGPLEATEPIDVGGVPVRIIHRPGRGHLAEFALDVTRHALPFFVDYYGIDYPSDKVDLVAIPDFAFGAMENLGCVTFREVLLLLDPTKSSQAETQLVADVINHELAHMWFGDLVTMAWWEGIWLNEAFATFMELKCSDSYRPDWDVWTRFGAARSMAFDVDSLEATRPIEFPVITPADAEGMFDLLTYEKGASVVRMLEQFLGADSFRDGVRLYLKRHSYGNTQTTDLWDAIEEASGQPVRAMMDDWILQGGYPIVDLSPGANDGQTVVTQRRHTLDPAVADNRTWHLPVGLRLDDDTRQNVLVHEATTTIDVAFDSIRNANFNDTGFYRVATDPSRLASIAMQSDPERHGAVDTAWAQTLDGTLNVDQYLELAEALATNEQTVSVWNALMRGLGAIHRIVPESAAHALHARLRALFSPGLERLGSFPRTGDCETDQELRAIFVRGAGILGADSTVRDQLDELRAVEEGGLLRAALAVAAYYADEATYDSIRAVSQTTTDPQNEQRHLQSLPLVRVPELAQRLLDEIRSGSIRTQDGPFLVRLMLSNSAIGRQAWDYMVLHWDELESMFPSNTIPRMLTGITGLDQPEMGPPIAAFLAEHSELANNSQVRQAAQRREINAAFRISQTPVLLATVGD